MTLFRRVTVLCVSAGMVACGGPGTVVSIYSTGNNTGYVTDGAYQSALHGIEPIVGDVDGDVNGSTVRGLLEFSLDTIPQTAVLSEAKLVLYQCLVVGNPYGKLGDVEAEQVTYTDPFGTGDFATTPVAELGILSDNATIEKKSLNVTSTLQSAVKAGDGKFQVRLRESIFNGNADTVTDYAAFATEGFFGHYCRGLSNDNPLLIVTYH